MSDAVECPNCEQKVEFNVWKKWIICPLCGAIGSEVKEKI